VTADVRNDHSQADVVRRYAAGAMRHAVIGAEHADLETMCRQVAHLARTRPEPPGRIRVEHLGTILEIEWPPPGQSSAGGSPATSGTEPSEAVQPAVHDGLHRVCAPMIGTFYHAPEPGTPPFVSVGDTVAPGQQIGILEVMKMMSAVQADIAGTVREILVPDGGPVEYQQPLVAVEPAGAY
jgi:acetyl-CoA carboxylase biotin carboxyl carrier protein